MRNHPNAAVGFGSGAGVGALAVWAAGLAGVEMPAEVGAVIGGVVAGLALLIGREGVSGIARIVWRGRRA